MRVIMPRNCKFYVKNSTMLTWQPWPIPSIIFNLQHYFSFQCESKVIILVTTNCKL